jgi:hypothetical protein
LQGVRSVPITIPVAIARIVAPPAGATTDVPSVGSVTGKP